MKWLFFELLLILFVKNKKQKTKTVASLKQQILRTHDLVKVNVVRVMWYLAAEQK